MRRIAFVCIGLALTFLCVGCRGTSSSLPLVATGLKTAVSFQDDDTAYVGQLTCETDGTYRFAVREPSHLADFTLVFLPDGQVQSVYHGLLYDPGLDFLPYGGPVQTLVAALRHGSAYGQTVRKGKEFSVSGTGKQGDYRFVISPSGLPLSCESAGYTYLFSETALF